MMIAEHRTWRPTLFLAGAILLGSGCYSSTEPDPHDVVVLDTAADGISVGGYPRVSRFLPDDEASALATEFDWTDTTALPEHTPDGLPAVYYAVIRVDTHEQRHLLNHFPFPWSVRPLFIEELRPLPEGYVNLSGSGTHGAWAFALVPGRIYNIIRSSALDGDPAFTVVALRAPPPSVAVDEHGAVNLIDVLQAGAQWPAVRDPSQPSSSLAGDIGVSQQALTEILTDVGTAILEAAQGVVEIIQDIVATILGLTSDTANVTWNVTISTPDREWQPVGAPLLRTWGPARGSVIQNVGQPVFAVQVGNPLAVWRTTLGPGNVANFELPNDQSYRFCITNELNGSEVIDFGLNTTVCTDTIEIPDAAGAVSFPSTFTDQDLQAVTVSNDGINFIASSQLVSVRPPIVATGNQAFAVTPTGNGFVPGRGGRELQSRLAITTLDVAAVTAATAGFPAVGIPPGIPLFGIPPGPFAADAAIAVSTLLNVDIVWPDGNPSRVVFAHELGHHIFFQFIVEASPPGLPFLYAQHLNTVFLATLFAPDEPGDPFFETLAVNEAMADIIGVQLSGGLNRMTNMVPGTYTGDTRGTGDLAQIETYCNPTTFPPAGGCIERNLDASPDELPLFGGNQSNLETSRISTTLHDIFDDSVGDGSHNGGVWVPLTVCPTVPIGQCPSASVLVTAPGPSLGPTEESIAVPFVIGLFAGVSFWLAEPGDQNTMDEQTVMRGMTSMMRDGLLIPEGPICALYGLHTVGGTCPPEWISAP